MNENDRDIGRARGGATASSEGGSNPNKPARSSISSAATDATRAVRAEAKEVGAQAQQVAEAQAEKVKEAAETHMDGFADALRAASDELSKNQSGPAAEFVANAASGLEDLSRSLHGKSTAEMIESVRRFGRQNPMGFLAGSVLAGLALGRFAVASPSGNDHVGNEGERPSSTKRLAGDRFGTGS